MVFAAVLGLATDPPRSGRDLLQKGSVGSLVVTLLLLGLAAWHFRAWGLAKLVAVGLLAAGGLNLTLVDFGDGDLLWEQGYTGAELVAHWLLVVWAAVVLVGVLWSFIEVAGSTDRRSADVAASVAWWRRWGLAVVGVAVALWVLGLVFARTDDVGPPIETADESDDGRVLEDEWSITGDGEAAGSYIFSMIKTFSLIGEPDEDGVGGRLIWSEAEIDLCDVSIYSAGDGLVQIGIVSPTTEGCPGMLQAFIDFGLPEFACLFVRSDGTDDEYCAPLAVD
jgi:hypothetical protein